MDTLKDREKKDQELKKRLTAEQYRVTQEKVTEPPYSNKYWDCNDGGVYQCICCGAELFDSEAKYDSGCGWPSFTHPVEGAPIEESTDTSLGTVRTEVTCGNCGAHLGHVFPEEDKPSGFRYCINSASLNLEQRDK
ncbi:MAG: peptide-methionine (R)-S-oxide reductase MsrB [Actinomycetota bacterium]